MIGILDGDPNKKFSIVLDIACTVAWPGGFYLLIYKTIPRLKEKKIFYSYVLQVLLEMYIKPYCRIYIPRSCEFAVVLFWSLLLL